MKHFFFGILFSISALLAHAQGKLQIIHNCADPAASFVDIYVNGNLLLNNFQFRRATPFNNLAAGIYNIEIKDSSSTVLTPAIYSTSLTIANGVNYIAVAAGTVDAASFPGTPAFQLVVLENARENISTPQTGVNKNDVILFHGVADAPLVNIQRYGAIDSTLATNFGFGSFGGGYFTTLTSNFNVRITTSAENLSVGQFAANLQSLSLNNRAVTVLASGLVNAPSNAQAFGLFAVTSNGGTFVALPSVAYDPAQVQIIHNSADLAASPVDIWVNDDKVAANVNFRTATPFLNVPVSTIFQAPVDISITAANSTDTIGAIRKASARFNPNKYVAIASGIASPTGYNPDATVAPLSIFIKNYNTNVFTNPENCNVLVFHGCTDAQVVDVREQISNATLLNDFAYGSYSNFLSLPAENYALQITNQAGNVAYASYIAELGKLGLQGQTIVVLASGFLDPTNNSDGAAFGLWVATEDGGNLLELQAPVNPKIDIIHNSADVGLKNVILKIDGNIVSNNFQFRQHTSFQDITNGQHVIQLAAQPNVNNNFYTQTINTNFNYNYVVVLDGIATPSGYTPPSSQNPLLFVEERNGLTESTSPNVASVNFHHGSTDTPIFALSASGNVGLIDSTMSYTKFSEYVNLNNTAYTFTLQKADGGVVGNFNVPVNTLNWTGKAITLVASGFTNPSINSNGGALGLFAAVQGTTNLVPLNAILGVDDMNSIENNIAVYPNPANAILNLSFEQVANGLNEIRLVDLTGKIVYNTALNGFTGIQNIEIPVQNLNSGIYFLQIFNGKETLSRKVSVAH
jgi:hypothetical protein